jgi:hypothetical protein
MLYPLLCVALLLVGANASDANHTYIKMISGWDDITQPSRDFNSGWCHVAIQPNSTLAWDCHIEFTPVAGSEWGPGRTWNTTWNLGDPMQDDGIFKFVLGADESHKPLSKFSAFLQANNFMFHVAEKNPHDAILLKPSANGTNWDCSPHHLYPHKLPECRDSMIMQVRVPLLAPLLCRPLSRRTPRLFSSSSN